MLRWLSLVLVVSCASAAPVPSTRLPVGVEPVMPSAYRAREAAAVSLNATCEGCHTEQAAAWRTSMHRRAFDNAAFQEAVKFEPTPFCRGCHAPEANPAAPRVAAELGVACVTCHVTKEGDVLAGAKANANASPHAVTRSAAFAGTASCANCHEFPFPGAPSFSEAHLMQTTMLEHTNAGSERSCMSCHTSHSFSEVRDPKWLAANLRVRAERVGAKARITLEQPAPGHAFPTGDLFRRLSVKVGPETRYLARHFEGRRELTRDDRVFDTPNVVELPLAADATEVEWSVTLERVAQIGTGSDPAHAEVESSVVLHSGRLEK